MKSLSLENLDGLTGLAGLADRSGVDVRPILLRVLTDLYIQKPSHTPAEERHYIELSLRLIDVVDAATCATVEKKLASYVGAPAEILTRLGIALHGPRKDAEKTAATDPWLEDDLGIFEPSSKQDISTGSDAKSQTPAPETAPVQTTASAGTDYVAQRDTFFASDARERRTILLKLDYAADAQSVALAHGTNVVRYLEQAALAGRFQELTTLLQQSLGTSRALTGRIIADPLGEPFVISAKALAIPTDVFQRILMFLNPTISHSVDRVYELSDLFEVLPLPAALHVVAIWRAADRMEARTAIHRPLHSPDAGAAFRSEQQPQQAAGQPPAANSGQRRTPSGS